jgi:hypothetical protein
MSDIKTEPISKTTREARASEYRIHDRASFETPGRRGRELATLYAYAQLDVLVDLARLVSFDFFARPKLYIAFDDPGLDKPLAALNARYGFDEKLPSAEQRQRIFGPLFGTGGMASEFIGYRDGLLTAAAVYAEWTQVTGLQMVAANVRTMHHSFKKWLLSVSGASSNWSRWQALPELTEEVSYAILRDKGVTGVFGVATPPGKGWPYDLDTNGDKVVEEISRQLDPGRVPPLTQQMFSDLQRVALRGAEAIAAVVDFDSEDPDEEALRAVVTRCYIWYTALARVQPVVISVPPVTPAVMPAVVGTRAVSNGSVAPMLPA